ncbi:type II toxin-antitoxin system VapC family toxin [Microcoleus sp. N3A4]|uniref:type II toxin-antitoxin system VapC family toxin n=1 Tax=Microcoleus sp. N3A4 TaxID=3055379 RepID=UPI002FD567AC
MVALQGNIQLIELLKDADWLGVSVISQIEFLVFPGLTQDDRQIFEQFLQRVEVLGLVAMDGVLIDKIVEIRQQHRLKLPDAVIAAMAIQNSASLVTADREFGKVTILTVINW